MTRRRERLGSGIRQDEFTKTMNIPVDIFLLSILASFIQRTTGFGFGIFIMTALPLLLPSYGEATTLSGMLAMTTSLIVSLRRRKYLNWHHLLPILITFLFISTIAIFCLKHIDDAVLRRILGMVLILTSIYFAFFNTRIKLKTNIPTQVCAGTLSGLMGGFFGMASSGCSLFPPISKRQELLYGLGSNVLFPRQPKHAYLPGLQWFSDSICGLGIFIWRRWCRHRHDDRWLRFRPSACPCLQICGLRLHRHQRTHLLADNRLTTAHRTYSEE